MPAKKNASSAKRGRPKTAGQNAAKTPQDSRPQSGKPYGRGRQQLSAIVLFVVGVFLLAVVLIEGQNVWTYLHRFLYGMFGLLAIALPIAVLYIAIMYTMEKSIGAIKHKLWQAGVLVALVCAATQVFGSEFVQGSFWKQLFSLYGDGVNMRGGGLVGGLIGLPLTIACGEIGAKIILCLLIFLFLMLLTGGTLIGLWRGAVQKPYQKISEGYAKRVEEHSARFDIDVDLGPDAGALPQHPVYSDSRIDIPLTEEEERRRRAGLPEPKRGRRSKKPSAESAAEPASIESIIDKAVGNEKMTRTEVENAASEIGEQIVDQNNQTRLFEEDTATQRYVRPPIALLKLARNASNVDVSAELKQNADKLVDTLKSFGVQTRIVDVSRGPTVTRYELQPSAGVKISRITGLADDIALNLASAGVRIEAPIPNKPAVGIEVPNKTQDIVSIREIIESDTFEKAPGNLTVSLGRDISGAVRVADLAKMPHLLIAGATGSGKSVCINSFIMSLLYKSSPEEVKLLMVDPKVVELGVYNGIPHLLIPVVTDPRKAAGALNWAVTEMLKRYKIFADNSVRDLQGFNELARANPELQRMPQIVIIIDELADLMMAAPNEVEDAICRLAQMARAAGMHLVIATQRPSVDVITGVIKANIPSRIAFAVSSQVDSRTILDSGGAEKLLGRGDMLYYPVGYPKPVRMQGCFVSDKEVEKVIDFIKNKQTAIYDEKIIEDIENCAVGDQNGSGSGGGGLDDEDPMLPQAIECIMETGQASTSFLQRKLRLGYARAGRIMDMLEERGIIGPSEGSKPRQILITRQQYIEMKMRQDGDAPPEES